MFLTCHRYIGFCKILQTQCLPIIMGVGMFGGCLGGVGMFGGSLGGGGMFVGCLEGGGDCLGVV